MKKIILAAVCVMMATPMMGCGVTVLDADHSAASDMIIVRGQRMNIKGVFAGMGMYQEVFYECERSKSKDVDLQCHKVCDRMDDEGVKIVCPPAQNR